jgi:hypothetical protein
MPEMMAPLPEPKPETPLTLEPDPVNPEPDDIPEPVTPEATVAAITPTPVWAEHQALLQGFLGALMPKIDDHVKQYAKDAFQCIEDFHHYMKQQIELDKEKVKHVETVIDALATKMATQGLQVRHDPYTVTVQTMSPQGYPLTFQMAKDNAPALMQELSGMVEWLASQGYKPVV